MTDCDRYIEWISAQLDGELTADQERELERHLALCPSCRELRSQLAAAHAAFAQLDEVEAPEGFARGVMDRIQAQERQKANVVPLFKRPQIRALASVAACAVLCVGLYQNGLFQRADQPQGTMPAAFSVSEEEAAPQTAAASSPADVSVTGALAAEPKQDVSVNAHLTEPDSDALTAAQEKDRSDGTRTYEVAGQTVDAVLTLPALPEGAGVDQEWRTDEAGRPVYILTGAQMEELMALAEQQGFDLTGAATNSIGPEGVCALVLTGE